VTGLTGDARRLLVNDPERAVREHVAALVVALEEELARVGRKQQQGADVLEEIGGLARAAVAVARLCDAVTWPGAQGTPLEGIVGQLDEFGRRRNPPGA